MSRGAEEGAEILKSGGGMPVIWQCGQITADICLGTSVTIPQFFKEIHLSESYVW